MKLVNFRTNETPVVAHAPGFNDPILHKKDNPLWETICIGATRNRIIASEPLYSNCVIVTWNSTGDVSPLEKSLLKFGVQPLVLGKQESRWVNRKKIALTLEVLESINAEFVIGVDALDAVFIQHPNKAIERFQEMECEMLFNGESLFSPFFLKQEFQECRIYEESISPSPPIYLNAGAWISRKGFCQEFFKAANESIVPIVSSKDYGNSEWVIKESEQVLLHPVFIKFYPKTRIDYDCCIFQCLSQENSNTLGYGPTLL